MKCIECTGADLKSDTTMARMGFCRCKTVPIVGCSHSLAWDRNCADFSPASSAAVEQRTTWLNHQLYPHGSYPRKVKR